MTLIEILVGTVIGITSFVWGFFTACRLHDEEANYKLLIALSEEAIKLAKQDKSLALSDLIRCSNEIDNLITKCRKDPSAYSSDLNSLIELNSKLKLLIHSND